MVGDLPTNRTATHLHGGLTPWFSDGTPFQWFTPTGKAWREFHERPGLPRAAGHWHYYYPNDQSARLVWYHDHAIGITRLNAYAGIASAYIIVDDFEIGLVSSGMLPDLVGIPLVIQDKGFVPRNILRQDPTWRWGDPGSLWYPHDYEVNTFEGGVGNPKGRFDWGTDRRTAAFDGNHASAAGLVDSGSVPRHHRDQRWRVSEGKRASEARSLPVAEWIAARFYHLNLYPEHRSNSGEARVGTPGPVIYQVGTEGGFLPRWRSTTTASQFRSIRLILRKLPQWRMGRSTCCWRLPSEPTSSSTSTVRLREAASFCTTTRRDRSRVATAGMTTSLAAPTRRVRRSAADQAWSRSQHSHTDEDHRYSRSG